MLSELPLRITPTFSGSVVTSPKSSNDYRKQEPVRPALEIVTIEGRTFEICNRSTIDRYIIVAAERHTGSATYTTDIAFYLIGKDNPDLQNRGIEKGYPASLEELLSKAMETIRK